ncbi:ROK family protein [Bacillus infantis]|uniref:ROK family protein n=1 Tax=Bacillus infantis TaxID=324767 RepID=UPI003CF30B78
MYTIGVDIGGTKVKAGIFGENGKIHQLIEEPTYKINIVEQLIHNIHKLCSNFQQQINAIGIATAGRVNFEEGYIFLATSNLPNWTGTKVKEIVEREFNIPTFVDNDANCAAIAEVTAGAARDCKNVACITLGTGVGAGIFLNGQLVRGTQGGAGEFGHMILVPGGKKCSCGKKGCWEQYVSGNALQEEVSNNSKLSSFGCNPKTLFTLAHSGNPDASRIIDKFTDDLATGIMSIQNVLDLECYVIGGGLIDSSELWWDQFIYRLKMLAGDAPMLKRAFFKNNAGMYGSSLLALDGLGKFG